MKGLLHRESRFWEYVSNTNLLFVCLLTGSIFGVRFIYSFDYTHLLNIKNIATLCAAITSINCAIALVIRRTEKSNYVICLALLFAILFILLSMLIEYRLMRLLEIHDDAIHKRKYIFENTILLAAIAGLFAIPLWVNWPIKKSAIANEFS